jgi:hypothetical protein
MEFNPPRAPQACQGLHPGFELAYLSALAFAGLPATFNVLGQWRSM